MRDKRSAVLLASQFATALVLVAGTVWSETAQAQEGSPRVDRPRAPGTPPFGLGGTPERPLGSLTPQDDDWSYLFETIEERGNWDLENRLRAIPLDKENGIFLSLGFDSRAELEWFDEENFGDNPGRDGFANVRANVYGAISFADRARLVGAVKYGDRLEERFLAPPPEARAPDLHQAFVEVSAGDAVGGHANDLLLRAGRFELHYGQGRLVSARQGPNIRSDYDGVMARYRNGSTITDIFAVNAVADKPGAFNNASSSSNSLFGVYSQIGIAKSLNLDVMVFHADREAVPYLAGIADEQRTSVGVRLVKPARGARVLGYDAEVTYQFGRSTFGQLETDISAYSLTTSLDYRFTDAGWAPDLNVRVGYTSGDDDPFDGSNTTFRAPFPPGRYFGDTTPLGPGNLVGATTTLSVSPARKLTLDFNGLAFWRVEENDGTYSPPGFPVRGTDGQANFIGWELGVGANYRISPYLTLSMAAAHFFDGPYLEDNRPAANTKRLSVGLNYGF